MNSTTIHPDHGQQIANEFEHFLEAQNRIYGRVIEELIRGKAESAWMRFIFPQFVGLANDYLAERFSINTLDQAQRYLAHPILGEHLHECTDLVIRIQAKSISEIFCYPDDLGLHSSMTLFSLAAPEDPVFAAALLKYFRGHKDVRTIDILWIKHQRA